MAAYIVAMLEVDDRERFGEYAARTPEIVARHGGRFLARGGAVEVLEGDPYEGGCVLLEFPDVEAAKAWFNDPEYQEISQIRRAVSTGRFLLVEGAPPA